MAPPPVPSIRITAEGNVALNGDLNVLINPVASSGTNPTYTPTVGDMFNLIIYCPHDDPADYDHNGSVGSSDYDLWRSTFGNSVTPGTDADGNGNGVIDAGDYVLWRKYNGQNGSTIGSITGGFDTVTFSTSLPAGVWYRLNQTSTLLQLEFIPGGSGSNLTSAVPEPTMLCLSVLLCLPCCFGAAARSGKPHRADLPGTWLESVGPNWIDSGACASIEERYSQISKKRKKIVRFCF